MGVFDVDALLLGIGACIELPEDVLERDVVRRGVDNVAAAIDEDFVHFD